MLNRNNTYKMLALAAASAAILAACNFPGLGGRPNTAANNTATPGPLTGEASNAIGLDSGSGMEGGPMANTALPPAEVLPTPANLPSIRGGRWLQSGSTNGGAPEIETTCLQGGPLRMEFSRECPVPTPQPGPNGTWVVNTTCNGRMGPVEVQMTSQGDYTNHYSMDARFSLRPTDPNTPPRTVTIHVESIYQGPCQGNEGGQGGQPPPPQQGGQDQGGEQQGGEESGGVK